MAGATANDNLPLGPVRLRNNFGQPLSSTALLGEVPLQMFHSGGGCGERILGWGGSSPAVLAGRAGSGIRHPKGSLKWKARRRSTKTHELADGSCNPRSDGTPHFKVFEASSPDPGREPTLKTLKLRWRAAILKVFKVISR